MALLDEQPNPNLPQQRVGRREPVSGVLVPHSAENTPDYVAFDGGAEAVWHYIRARTTYGSYHFLADSDSRPQIVDWWNEAFHDATDRGNWHEIGGSLATRADVLPLAPRAWRDAAIDNLAGGFADAARWLRNERGIIVPPRRITRAESQDRKPGFIAHGSRDPGRRSDPGFDQNPELWDQFLDRYSVHAADVLRSDRPSPAPTPTLKPTTAPEPKDWTDMASITEIEALFDRKAGDLRKLGLLSVAAAREANGRAGAAHMLAQACLNELSGEAAEKIEGQIAAGHMLAVSANAKLDDIEAELAKKG